MRHIFRALALKQPNIIKIFLRMCDLCRAEAVPINNLRGSNYERKKSRFINHTCDTPTHSYLYPSQMLFNLKVHMEHLQVLWSAQNLSTDGRTDNRLIAVSPNLTNNCIYRLNTKPQCMVLCPANHFGFALPVWIQSLHVGFSVSRAI